MRRGLYEEHGLMLLHHVLSLSGSIPASLGLLGSLVILNLFLNELTGESCSVCDVGVAPRAVT